MKEDDYSSSMEEDLNNYDEEEEYNYENELSRKEHYYNEDDAYDQWRDEQSEALDRDIKEVIKKYYKENRYYKNNLDKIKQHIICGLEHLKEDSLKWN